MSEEIIDLMAREGLKRVHGANLETKGKIEWLASELEKIRNTSREITQSTEQDKLWTAFSAAKAEMSALEAANQGMEKTGHAATYGSYATVDDLRLFIDPILHKHGLSFVCEPIVVDDKDYLKYRLNHSSGQFTSECCKVNVDYSKGRDAYQSYATALTYLKKQIYGAFFMIHTGGEK